MPPKLTNSEPAQGLLSLVKSLLRRGSRSSTWTWLFVAVGVLLRIAEYAGNREIYIDEASLLRNLVGRPIFDFVTPLTENQLAPPGFLVIERAMVRLPLGAVWAARLVPLLCGVASIFLMRSLARRFVSARAVPIAMGLFALNVWMLYYTTEIKQYSSDICLTIVALLLASAPADLSRRRRFILGVFGVVGVWFSHPLALVLAVVGTYLAGAALVRRQWRTVATYAGWSSLWALSFVLCYKVSHQILTKDRFIWNWWDFAFLPIPPRSYADLERLFWQVLNIFNNPAWLVTPLGVLGSAFVALALYVIGAVSLGRRWRGGLYLLIGPLLLTLIASALHQYPFHGRLLLFLVPAIQLLVAEGVVAAAWPGGVFLTVVVGACLLAQPVGVTVWHEFVFKRLHHAYDSHGDLEPDLLDYLDRKAIANPSTRALP
jgi:hypothetical protein